MTVYSVTLYPQCFCGYVSRAARGLSAFSQPVLLFRAKFLKKGDMTMKGNFGVIWTETIEIEELEAKVAPSGMLVEDVT